MDISKIFPKTILNTAAYKVVDVPEGFLKLDAMELGIDFPPSLKTKWLETLKNIELNRYPVAHNNELDKLLRKVFAISPKHQILFGNGSDELIQILAMAVRKTGNKILAVEPSFVMYEMVANYLGLDFIKVALNTDFSLNMERMARIIQEQQPALIFLAYPNNPTGNAYSEDEIKRIAELAEGIVLIDEAYQAFSGSTLKHLAEDYDNVLILRTLSKVGFAGCRFGYLFGNSELIEQIDKVRPPYNVNVLTTATIIFALQNYKEIQKASNQIPEEREKLFKELQKLKNCQVINTKTNFLLLKVPDSKLYLEELKKHKILVKNVGYAHPYLENCLRLTVGFAEDNKKLLAALMEIVNAD